MADVIVDGLVSTSTARGMRAVVFTTDQIGYRFYIDNQGTFVYSKTTDGGATWGAAVTISATTTTIAFDVWFDQWTPGDTGTLIHMWYFDSTADDVLYKQMNTLTDSQSPTPIVVFAGSTAVAGRGTFVSGTKTRTGYYYCAYDIDAGAERGFHRSTDGGGTWSANLSTTFVEATLDEVQLFPASGTGDNNDCWAIYIDASTAELTCKMWDSSAAAAIESAAVHYIPQATDLTGQYGYSGSIRHSDGALFVSFQTEYQTAAAAAQHKNHLVTWGGSNFTVTAKAILTAVFNQDHYYPQVFIDQTTDNIYVVYNGKRDSSEALPTATKVYYAVSTDGGTTWSGGATSGDTAYMEGAVAAVVQVWAPIMGPRLFASWRVGSALYGNNVNSLTFATTTPVSNAFGVAYEALQLVTLSAGRALEALSSIVMSKIVAYETTQSVAQTKTPAFEALQGIARSYAVPLESKQPILVAAPYAVSLEALGRVAQASLVAYESKQPITRAVPVELEARQGVLQSRSVSLEALARAVQTITVGLESRQFVARGVTPSIESLQPITQPKLAALEALQGITRAHIVALEAKQPVLVIASYAVAYEALGRVSQTSFVQLEALTGLAQPKTVALEARAAAARVVPVALESRQPVAQTRSVALESLQYAVAQRSVSAESLQGVSNARAVSIELRQGVSRGFAVPYESLSQVLFVTAAYPVAIEALGRVSRAALTPIVSLRAISAQFGASIEARQGVSRASQAGLEALASVSSPHPVSVETLQAIAATRLVAVETLQGVRLIAIVPLAWQGNPSAPFPFDHVVATLDPSAIAIALDAGAIIVRLVGSAVALELDAGDVNVARLALDASSITVGV